MVVTVAVSVDARGNLYLQASLNMASRLGWSLDSSGTAGEVDPDSCTEKIRGLFSRAQYYKQGKIQEKESGKPFAPDWEALAKGDPVQAELSANMVWALTVHLPQLGA